MNTETNFAADQFSDDHQRQHAVYAWHFFLGYLAQSMKDDHSLSVAAALRQIAIGFSIPCADDERALDLLKIIGGEK